MTNISNWAIAFQQNRPKSPSNKKTQQPLAGLVQSTSLTVIKVTATDGLAPHSNGSPSWVIFTNVGF
ncbi:hypothetical protein H6F88_26420 [Oculatella sp. FACHB-28]|uniref:hypothetical protein n=1 Tax=Oculatella sp. FACHB-28 TaxID=2692845 RepID=UPI001684FA3E|nr:hypothetical protein [Oculatella sp. FACHB-28]MBD2059488.1 hypothetical protein [Oculatella sp. FACHB-28]